MSTRERAQLIFDSLTEEQLEGFVMMFAEYAPKHSELPETKEELKAMLDEADKEVRDGKYYTREEMDEFFGRHFEV